MAGFECEFSVEPPKVLQTKCPVCLLVLREPYQATCCGKSFCKECIERVKRNNQACPTCNDRDFNLFHNKGLQQSLYDFQVYCSHKSKGCEWTGELRELDKHLNSEPPADKSLEGCPFTAINCPLSHTGCKVRLPRMDVKVHMNDELLSHVMKQTTLFLTLIQDNKTLNNQLEMVNTQLHSVERGNECLKQQVDKLEGQLHLVEGKKAELEGEIKELKEAQEAVARTGQPIGPVELTMIHFPQHKQDDDMWFSPPFYTHPHGYKMCMRVWPNGFGKGKGTHLGVAIYLMRGEFDDQLKWPFRGDITIQLLNQNGERVHCTKTVSFNDRAPAGVGSRVSQGTVGVASGSGLGFPKFVSHNDLRPKLLKNDCLRFRIAKVKLK